MPCTVCIQFMYLWVIATVRDVRSEIYQIIVFINVLYVFEIHFRIKIFTYIFFFLMFFCVYVFHSVMSSVYRMKWNRDSKKHMIGLEIPNHFLGLVVCCLLGQKKYF